MVLTASVAESLELRAYQVIIPALNQTLLLARMTSALPARFAIWSTARRPSVIIHHRASAHHWRARILGT